MICGKRLKDFRKPTKFLWKIKEYADTMVEVVTELNSIGYGYHNVLIGGNAEVWDIGQDESEQDRAMLQEILNLAIAFTLRLCQEKLEQLRAQGKKICVFITHGLPLRSMHKCPYVDGKEHKNSGRFVKVGEVVGLK